MKKILFICLALLLNGCIAPYRPYGYGYGGNSYYRQPYYNGYSHYGYGGNYGGYRGNYGGFRGGYGGFRGGHYH